MKKHFWLILYTCLIVLLLQNTLTAQENASLSLTLQDHLLTDQDGDGLADPGDIIRYTALVTNCGNNAAENVQMNASLDPHTSLKPGSVQIKAPQASGDCSSESTGGSQTSNPTPVDPSIPSVTVTTPTHASTEIALGTNLSITFSEAVTTTGDWFQMVCTVSGTFNPSAANATITGGPTTFTLDPNVDLLPGETCTVTVVAAQVHAQDNNAAMAANHVFSFTTETPPTITATTPTNGATTVSNNSSLIVTFDEPVTVAAASFTLECPAATPIAFTVSGSGTNTITIDPTTSLPGGVLCTVVAVAANISDVDTNDVPDLLDGNGDNVEGDDYTFTFTTDLDSAPTVQTIAPANAAVSVASTTTITVTFDEVVEIGGAAAFSLECPTATPIGFTVTTPAALPASATTFILTPAGTLPVDTTCTVTVFAAQVTDTDTIDPPDTMAADFVSTFTTEAPPTVTVTTPANATTGVATNSNIVIDFNEPVTVTAASFTLECPTATPITFAVSGSGTNSITLDPTGNLPATTTCTVTVVAVNVTDTDVIDPPDTMTADYTFTFDTLADTAPTVASTTPTNAATGVTTGSNITVTFNEAVDVTAGAFALECPVGTPTAFTVTPALPATNTTVFTLDPTGNLPATTTCTVTVNSANVIDTDGDDPPNAMAANYSFTFDTIADTAPTATSTLDGATNVATGASIDVTFNEAVDVTAGAFALECPVGTPTAFTVTPALPATNATTFTLDPTTNIAANTTCTVTVNAANVTDTDLDEPPDAMAADYTFTFDTLADTAPTVLNTTPANAATGITTGSNITVTFSEAVDVTAGAFVLECPVGSGIPFTVTPALPATNTTVFTLDPTGVLPATTTCTVTVNAANVTDTDLDEPPDAMAADYTFTFDTLADTAPTVLNTTPANAATGITTGSNITVTFDEAVDVTAGAFVLECPVGSAIPFTVTPALPATNTTVFTLDPTGNLPATTTCTVTVNAANVIDTDGDDPPNAMAANYSFTFDTLVDTAPTVLNTTPANAATGVATGANILITFSEAVDVTAGAFALECPVGLPIAFTVTPALPATNTTAFTLNPAANIPTNTTCTATVNAANVSDTDGDDPPNAMAANYSFGFTTLTDVAPTVASTLPTNAATGVTTGSNILITFSEAVDVTAGAFALECPVGSPIAFTVTPALPVTNTTLFTLDPTGVLPATTTCTVMVNAANVTDTDLDEPPDAMAADYTFTFDTVVDAAPAVDQAAIAPASTSGGPNAATLNDPVSTTPTITIPFSEAVNAATGAFTLACPAAVGLTVSPALPATNQTSLDITPAAALTPGATCTLTVVAANISDTDTDDPPNTMAANYTVTFTVDTAPAEVLTETEVGGVFQDVTGAGANNVDLDSDIQLTFDEAVTVTVPANALQCPAGSNIPTTVTGNGTTTVTLNPTANLPVNTLCVLNIPAASIADVDTADAPDTAAAAVNHSFQTVNDNAPTVTTNPTNGGGNVAVNANITVTFNEPVTLTGGWFGLTCTVSGNRVSTGELTGTGLTIIENTPNLVYTIDPTVNFGVGDACTITIDSANAVDDDLIDPPNELDGNASLDVVDGDADDYVATFSTTDMAPRVIGTTPTASAAVDANQVVTLNFSEAVDIAAGAFAWQCPAGTPITGGFTPSVPLPANAVTTIDLTPVNPLPFGAACVVTAESTLITDDDLVDPPHELDGNSDNDVVDGDADDFTLAFTVDAQATETLTEVEVANVFGNAAGATNVDLDSNIRVTFSEPVNVTLASFDLECPTGSDIAFTLTGSGTNTIVIDPTPAALLVNALCDLDIIAANITDVDPLDAPDVLDADVNYTFTIVNDNAPTVTSAEAEVANTFTALPLGAGVYADPDTLIRLTFSEVVNPTGAWASLVCSVSGTRAVGSGLGVTVLDPVFVLVPMTPLTVGEDCTLTVFAAQVADDDAIDPPNTMAANAVYTFSVQDTPPQVNAGTSTPANGAIVPNNQTVTLNFTEMVDIAVAAITWQCGVTNITFTPALPQNNVTSVTLTPSVTLPNGASCTVTLESTLITDDDIIDGANELDGNADNDTTNGDADDFTRTFTVDTEPTLTSAEAEIANTFTALPLGVGVYADADTNLRLTFSEAVDPTGNWASLVCTTSGTQTVGAGTLAVTAADPVFTLNPATNLTAGETCTLTVFAAQVADDDAIDPPNTMVADAVYSFSVQDVAPQVNAGTSTPANGAIVSNNQAVTLNFTEMVDIAAAGITWQCGATNITFTPALPQNNVTTVTLTPSVTLTSGASCTVTLESTLITDDDAVDGPNELDGNADNDTTNGDADDFTRTFTVDSPPAPVSVSVDVGGTPQFLPLGVGQTVDIGSDIRVTFSEAVNATAAGLTLECPTGSPVAFTGLPTANTTTVTLNPTANLPNGVTCTLTLVAASITDNDAFDPPNTLDGNGNGVEGDSIGFTFSTTAATAADDAYTVTPHLTYTSPTGVRGNDNPTTVTITGFGNTLGTANGMVPNGTNFITAGGAGGRVVMNADGTFTFYPDAGDDNTDGTVTFFYTITGGDTAQVTLTYEAEEFVWFADFGGGCTVSTGTNVGTQACPATDFITTIATNHTANDIIFLDSGPYQCGVTLQNNVMVIGNGSSSTLTALVASRVTPVAGSNFAPYDALNGTAPTLNFAAGDCFTLGQNNTLRGFTVANTPSGHSYQDNGGTIGTATILEVSDTGTGGIFNFANGGTLNATMNGMTSTSSPSAPILLTNIAGTITQTGGGTITHTGNFDLIDINGGSVGGTISSILNATNGNGSVVDVSGGHTGTLTFSGEVYSTALYAGDNLQFDNADGSYNFTSTNVDLFAGTAGINIQNGSDGSLSIPNDNTNELIRAINGITIRVNNSAMTVDLANTILHNSVNNRGIEVINGTGAMTFNGFVQIGNTLNLMNATGVFLSNTGNANLISFADLAVWAGTGGVASPQAFVSEISGRIAVTTGQISCNGNLGNDNHCFDVSDTISDGVTFADLSSDHDDGGENGGAIYLNNTPGAFTFTNFSRMTGNNAVIVQANNFGTLTIGTGTVGNIETNNRAAIDLQNGAVNIIATLIRSSDSPTYGISIDNTTGTFTVTGTGTTATSGGTIANSGTSGVRLNNSTALDVSLANMQLTNANNTTTGTCNNDMNHSDCIGALDVRSLTGTSSVTLTQVNVTTADEVGMAFQSSRDITVTNSTISGTPAHGIYGRALAGNVTINESGGGTSQISGYGGTVAFNGRGIYMNDMQNGFTFTLADSTITGTNNFNEFGAFLVGLNAGSTGTVSITNNTFTNTGAGSSFGSVVLNDVMTGGLDNATLSSLVITGNTFSRTLTGVVSGLNVYLNGAVGDTPTLNGLNVGSNTFDNMANSAVSIIASGSASFTGRIQDNIMTNTNANGITVWGLDQTTGNIYILNNQISTNIISPVMTGIFLRAANATSGSPRIDFNVDNNTITDNTGGNLGSGIQVNAHDFNVVCLDLNGNTAYVGSPGSDFVSFRLGANSTMIHDGWNGVDSYLTYLTGKGNIVSAAGGQVATRTGTHTAGSCAANPIVAAPSSTTVVEAPSFGAVAEVVAESSFVETLFSSILNLGVSVAYAQAPATVTIPFGTIPARSTVSATFDVVVGENIASSVDFLTIQGTLSGLNVLSNDPDTQQSNDPTNTPLDPLRNVKDLPATGQAPWWRSWLIVLLGLGVLSPLVVLSRRLRVKLVR